MERSRLALLNFLAETIPTDEIPHTTVVFDAGPNAPPGLPRTLDHHGLTVRFASGYENADELIEELIQADSAPRNLTVVSSDHRVQRAAKRRKAQAIDSDVWFAQIQRDRKQRRASAIPEKPPPPTSKEVEYWLKVFDEGKEEEG